MKIYVPIMSWFWKKLESCVSHDPVISFFLQPSTQILGMQATMGFAKAKVVTTQAEDDFQHVSKRSTSKNTQKRLYIGNLPTECDGLEEKLVRLLKETANCDVGLTDVTIHKSKSCHALIACHGNLDDIIARLNRFVFEKRRLVVQKERKQPNDQSRNNRRPAQLTHEASGANFGKSWSKPANHEGNSCTNIASASASNRLDIYGKDFDFDHVGSAIGEVVAEEMEQSRDPAISALVSTAAVSLVLSSLHTSLHDNMELDHAQDDNEGDFMSRAKQPVSALLAEYGEADPDWMKVQPSKRPQSSEDDINQSKSAEICTGTASESRLGQRGKAPIHVELQTFGYHFGAPSELRNGWSHAQPLPVFDTRNPGSQNDRGSENDDNDEDWDDNGSKQFVLSTVPPHLQWQDGLSGAVKHALLKRENGSTYREYSNHIAKQIAQALVDAIDNGGHGYVLPLNMTIYIGSDRGRHRSVVASELAAIALRQLLRTNERNRFAQPCSVGTFHRELHRQKQQHAVSKSNNKDDDW